MCMDTNSGNTKSERTHARNWNCLEIFTTTFPETPFNAQKFEFLGVYTRFLELLSTLVALINANTNASANTLEATLGKAAHFKSKVTRHVSIRQSSPHSWTSNIWVFILIPNLILIPDGHKGEDQSSEDNATAGENKYNGDGVDDAESKRHKCLGPCRGLKCQEFNCWEAQLSVLNHLRFSCGVLKSKSILKYFSVIYGILKYFVLVSNNGIFRP